MKGYNLIGSSPTEDGIKNLISKFYGGSTITLEGEKVYNLRGRIEDAKVEIKGKRYRFLIKF